MVKEVPAYVCEKCGYYKVGENNRFSVIDHEHIPVTGRSNSIDGLVGILGGGDNISVFRRFGLNQKHEILYSWNNYSRKGLDWEKRAFPEDLERQLSKIFPTRGFTAAYIKGAVLIDPNRGYREFRELSEREFSSVCKGLKKKYQDLYENTKFKRTIRLPKVKFT